MWLLPLLLLLRCHRSASPVLLLPLLLLLRACRRSTSPLLLHLHLRLLRRRRRRRHRCTSPLRLRHLLLLLLLLRRRRHRGTSPLRLLLLLLLLLLLQLERRLVLRIIRQINEVDVSIPSCSCCRCRALVRPACCHGRRRRGLQRNKAGSRRCRQAGCGRRLGLRHRLRLLQVGSQGGLCLQRLLCRGWQGCWRLLRCRSLWRHFVGCRRFAALQDTAAAQITIKGSIF